jgi:Transglycosylase SLT domain
MLAEAANAANNRSDVIAAIRQASAETGSDFSFLLGTAMRESSLKPQAKSDSSSATGLFQFVDQTWLGLVKQHGAQFGLGSYASQISQSSNGRYRVSDASDRQAILALRKDPKIAALMEGEYANQAKCSMQDALGRNVCDGELYAAHFLGAGAATHLIEMNEKDPGASAAAAFPQAADANRSVFYHPDGSAKTVREVYDWATRQPGGEDVPDSTSAPVQNAAPSTAYAGNDSLSDQWTALQMFSGGSVSPSVSMTDLPSAPFMLTPGVLQILSSLMPDKSSHSSLLN